ncbi:MAG: histidine phosphatase family protein [Candidatus Dormibacteraeota bacterium]|nr:histidine phosphatase family protein [Candidatus Dormibacteraeota bacterium]
MILLLVRHGLTDLTQTRLIGRLPGIPLNARGRAQAVSAAERLSVLPVAAIYCSPMQRTVETATPLAQRLGMGIQEVPGLLEVDYGEWAGQEFKALRKSDLWKVVQQHPARARFPGGESLRAAQARIVDTLEEIGDRHPHDIVAAYSHSDMIRLAVAHFVGMHLDLYQRTEVAPGSVTALQLGGARPTLLRLSDTGTLEDLRPPRRRGKN